MSINPEFFAPDGPLAALIPEFIHRLVQVEMADTVTEMMLARTNGLMEAGTGTGKTLAYLIPALHCGHKTIISTGTRTLQDQLYFKDLPAVLPIFQAAGGRGMRTALLKGRRNYLCPYRLQKNLEATDKKRSPDSMAQLTAIREWAARSHSGDLSEIADLSEDAPVLPLVTSTADNCLGSRCPEYSGCPLYKAREKALDADLIIVNHHLLFADLALKEDNTGRLLPSVDTIIVDEAHQVPEIARHFFGSRVGSTQMTELVADVRRESFLFGNDDTDLLNRADHLDRRLAMLVESVNRQYSHVGLARLLCIPDVTEEIADVDYALTGLIDALGRASIRSQMFSSCYGRALQLSDQFALLTEPVELNEDYVQWIERRKYGFDIHMSPVSVGHEMATHINHGDATWLFTSATLTVNGSFTHFRDSLGLDDNAIERRFESPFNYREQVRAWIPDNLPMPGTDRHTSALVDACLPLIQANPGRTFFLFTSYRALRLAASLIAEQGDVPVMVQGSMSKHALLEKFVNRDHAVLLATQSFWEGVDVRGAALKCLIIDKLPFMSPEDPLSQALMSALDRSGGNAFTDYLLPRAVISLKQGFGRLIRQESDKGLFVLGDPRMVNRGYGSIFRTSLSDMDWLDNQADAVQYLSELTD
ncbi:MAG: ATP-dependent DNA helicase [Pseudomonadales bacterium]